MPKLAAHVREVSKVFERLLDEYASNPDISESLDRITIGRGNCDTEKFDLKKEEEVVAAFLRTPCSCFRNCERQLDYNEVVSNRAFSRSLEKKERNYALVMVLKSMLSHSEYATSARSKKSRERKKFDYRIGIDRPVCQAVFLFYYGESSKRLERLKSYVSRETITIPTHGNSERTPQNAYTVTDRERVKVFVQNFTSIHGLPDPGRDVRKGKGRLRILLPSLMSYYWIHQQYTKSIEVFGGSRISGVGYRTFIKIWQDEFPHIRFSDPRSDLCMKCEDFKKQLKQMTGSLDEEKDKKREQIHKNALEHLKLAKKERLFYKANTKVAGEYYHNLGEKAKISRPCKANSKNILSHYSWDFAQQLQYPFEDQQVGPIFFKTPRRAQLFGVCCEGIPRQYNYLIDEEHFLEKNANTVISLLDHFFINYGLGEKWVHLTADNCVGQNKNNALLQYLMYRVLTGLHDKIDLSFLIVGHTKFFPDGFFGLIKLLYRKSQVYTYDQLADTIESSSRNGHNVCVRATQRPEVIYRDWTTWLSQYFATFKGISKYHHFKIDRKKPSVLIVKECQGGEETEIDIAKKTFPFSKDNPPRRLPKRLLPAGLSLERQWYLYDQIRRHIPVESHKDQTCPRPAVPKTALK